MNFNSNNRDIFKIGIFLILTLTLGRYIAGGFDFSYFISAGSDFVDSTKIVSDIIVSSGQGYDGQFFYRLALDPFNFSKEIYGITLDYPEYRSQRIVYPFMSWILSFGGYPPLVPFSLVLVNIISFLGTIIFFKKITDRYNQRIKFQILVFFLFGMYLSVAKDLSEVTELFFFTGAIWFMLVNKWWVFTLFTSLTLLTRETSVIAFIPLITYIIYRKKHFDLLFILRLTIPFLFLAVWKYYVHSQTGGLNSIDGIGNFTLPFQGIFPGLKANLDISSTIKKLQLLFWLAYFLWQLWFIKIISIQIYNLKNKGKLSENPFVWMYACWLIFAIFLSESIYIDDWSFVRVFSLWNMIGLLILGSTGGLPRDRFYWYSSILLLLTVIRLIIK